MTTTIYGIKNCDTMKKALNWLEERGVSFTFHDYKKQGVDETVLRAAIEEHGWEEVINRRGTTWRTLPDDVKNAMDTDRAVQSALENPSIIKRPLLVHRDNVYLGFKTEIYANILGRS